MDNIRRDFVVGDEVVHALRGISLTITEGEFVTIMGTSGSGKSTLLNTLGCLDTPTSGEYYLDGIAVRSMDKNARATLRNRKIGFVFQNYNLLAKTTALENVELAQQVCERALDPREVLEQVGLGQRMNNFPAQLSGGMLQRAAAALLLALHPRYILADEPTSALDAENRTLLLELLEQQRESAGILFISHDVAALRALCGTVYVMEHGMLTEQGTMQELLEHPKQAWTKEYAAANRPVNREGWTWTD